jgi:hypothetical protein
MDLQREEIDSNNKSAGLGCLGGKGEQTIWLYVGSRTTHWFWQTNSRKLIVTVSSTREVLLLQLCRVNRAGCFRQSTDLRNIIEWKKGPDRPGVSYIGRMAPSGCRYFPKCCGGATGLFAPTLLRFSGTPHRPRNTDLRLKTMATHAAA